MSFEVGRLSAALTLDGVAQFHRDLDAAGQKLEQTGQKGASFGRAAEAAVRTAAGATTGLVTAATAYLGILTKIGVGYNSLQQNSRAALNVLLGGAEKANVQMAKLDDFARNSPFSKSVFIEAQQQLLGFGMEAGKVVPTLDAIQQGVAAMGGSNEQISEVVNILANVQSTGKITAETFNQLGYRGLDAAQIIGDSMGKTAAQVRDDVSDAALDGRKAIDYLVEGMQDRFGGAADGVKEQWSGAVDRIKAAQRDLGAHLAEPFVSAQGGGMAVTWGNQVADVLRAVEKQAVPVMDILTRRGMPFFAGLTEGLDSTAQSIKRWDASTLDVALDKLAGHAPGIAATAGAVLALGANVGPLGQMLSVLGISANPAVAAFVGLAAASPELRSALGDLLAAGKPLLPVIGDLAKALSGSLNAAVPVAADAIGLLTKMLEPAVALLDAIPSPVLAGAAAFLVLNRATSGLSLTAANAGLTNFMSHMRQSDVLRAYNAGLSPTAALMAGVGQAGGAASAGVRRLGDSLKAAFMSNPIGIALTAVSIAIGAWAAANASAQQKVQEHQAAVSSLKDTLNQTTGEVTEATRKQIETSLAQGDGAEALKVLGISHTEAAHAITEGGIAYDSLTQRIRSNTDMMILSTDEEARNRDSKQISLVQQQNLLQALDDELARQGEARAAVQERIQAERDLAGAMSDSERSSARFNEALAVARDVTQDAETRVRALKQALDELNGGQITAEEAAKRLSATNLTLAEGLEATGDAGEKLWQQTLDGAGNIDLASREGLAFADAMGASRDAMLDAALAASDQALANGDLAGAVEAAKDAGNGYIDTLRETMTEAGLTEGQIDGLIGKYLDVPDLVATVLAADGLDEAEAKVLSFLAQLTEIPEGETLQVTVEGNEEAIRELEQLGYTIEESPDGKTVEITAPGADKVIEDMEQINGTWIPEKVVEIDADATSAFEGIEGVEVVEINDKTAMVYGNNADAQAKIDDVIAKGIPGKTSIIDANDAAFWARWAVIEAAAPIRKVVEIVESVVSATDSSATGNLFQGGEAQAFATGGMPSGFYKAPPGQAAIHKFAERELPWEAYISPKPGYRQRNINIALESLKRLAFPVVPASHLRGVPAFATGGMSAQRPSEASHAFPALAGESRQEFTFQTTVHGAPGQSAAEIARIVDDRIETKLRGLR